MIIRIAGATDLPAIIALYRDTIRSVNSRDYNPQQIAAWSDRAGDTLLWERRLAMQHMIVAMSDDQVSGFASLTTEGYLDCLFVHKDFQRRGIAAALLNRVEAIAASLGCASITADVSLTAKTFFLQHGFTIRAQQEVFIAEVAFTNFSMIKRLN